MKSYFEENMKLLDEDNREALFKSGNSIYTKIRDDNPTRYINGSKAKNVMVADGCVIEGTVENSILSRGVKIGKNAKVKNCILLQDTVIEDGANLEYVIKMCIRDRGTATEVTAFSIITDYEKGIKYPIADFEITPCLLYTSRCV